jgi:hypothetical protein
LNSVFGVGAVLPIRNRSMSYRKTNSGCVHARNLLETCFQSITPEVQVDVMIHSVSCARDAAAGQWRGVWRAPPVSYCDVAAAPPRL